MKRYFTILLTLFAVGVGYGQNLTISFDGNVEEMTTDLDARALFPKRDINDRLCALIKVTLTNALKNPLVLETGALGVTDRVEQESGEVWFYVPAEVKNLSFKCAEYAPLDPIPVRLKEGTVFRITLNPDAMFETVSNVVVSSKYLRIKLSEANATISIGRSDQYELISNQKIVGDFFSQLLDYGDYYFKVEHPLCETYYGTVKLDASTDKVEVSLTPAYGYLTVESSPSGAELYMGSERLGTTPCRIEERLAKGNVELSLQYPDYYPHTFTMAIRGDGSRQTTHQTLKPRFANITLTCPDKEAEIWVDNEFKAKGTWTGRLGSLSGHIAEVRRAGHQSQSINITVVEGEDRSYTLPNPIVLYGTLNITTTPAECILSVDGRNIGETPAFEPILSGEHTLTISKKGYITKTLNITIEHNQTLAINEVLEEDTEARRLEQLRKTAEGGDVDLQFDLGNRYYNGDGVSVDYAEAVRWYRMAAEQGHAEAQFNLAKCYFLGNGVEKNHRESAKWYSNAARQGVGYLPNVPTTHQIIYTTTNGDTITPKNLGANIQTNTNIDGRGVIVLDRAITSIGENAFRSCSTLSSIVLPESVTSIASGAFFGCVSLPIEDNVMYADTYVVEVVDKTITSVTLKEGTRSIGDKSFWDCANLVSITIPEGVTTIGNSAFIGCTSLTSVTIPDSVTSIGSSAFRDCSSLTSVTIGNGVTSIGIYAFSGCSSLASVTIGNGVTSIGDYAFYNCSSLASINIPDSVTSIGSSAFYNCSSLTSVTIPDSVTSIGSYTFGYCSSLTSVTIPDSVTSIGSWAFYNCSSLTSITIPDSVTSIGYEAFYYCKRLKSVYCKPTTPPSGDSHMFYNNASGRKIYVPRGSVNTYKSASQWSAYADYIVGYDF